MTIEPQRAGELLDRFADQRILVVGDLMLDRYVYGTVDRISPEAPVPVVVVSHEKGMPGGACNVAWNIQTLGGHGMISGLLGDDPSGRELKRLLEDVDVGVSGVLDHDEAHTTVKTRIVAERQQLVRVDREKAEAVSAKTLEAYCETLRRVMDGVTGVIIEDYGKGLVEQQVVDTVLNTAKGRGIPVGYDPKENHELDVAGITMATPNRKETFLMAGLKESPGPDDPMQDERLKEAGRLLWEKWKPGLCLLLTLGPQGILLVKEGEAVYHVPTRARAVFDVSGAGDTVVATCILAIAAGATPEEAAELANIAAGVVVAKVGTAPCTMEELRGALH